MSTPDDTGAWSGPSGLRVERVNPAGQRPHPAASVALEPGPAGEPMWLTPAQWADLCAACAELGPGFAPDVTAGPAVLAAPATAAGQAS